MKKLLIATTALVASASMASAGISMSGSAAGGFFTGNKKGSIENGVYSSATLTIKMDGETDNGLSFGASMDVDAGQEYDIDDYEFDGAVDATSLGSVWISGDFGKISFDDEGIDDLYDDDYSHDVSYSGTFGGLSVDVTADSQRQTAAETEWSAKLAYSAGDYTGSLIANSGNNAKVAVSYKLNEFIKLSAEYDKPDAGDAVTEGKVEYTGHNITASVSADSASDWDVSLAYTSGAMKVSVSTDEESEWELSASYDLGGGASFKTGVNHASSAYAGLAFSF